MNEDLLQNDFLEQPENWLPAPLTKLGEQQHDDLQKLDGSCQGEAEESWSRSAESNSSGNECNGLESTGAGSRGSSDGNSHDPGRSKDNSSKSSKQLKWNQHGKKLRMVIQEMKRYLPAEKLESCGKTSTLTALRHALKCVRQVQTDSTAFELGASRASARAYSIEELAAVTSEHAPKSTGTFVAVFSLQSGKMVHVSGQAASILNCKKKWLDSSRFVELLDPQDVAVFYTNTNPSQLPLWNMETQTASLFEYTQVKSFFCRIKGGKEQELEKRYCPFRITPYLVSVCLSDHEEPEPCCLALAEKIHSGYEAPRIPLEKRIFTTIHNPGCVFLEIDDRTVPLLGYLPQDLRGTSILMYLHPEDRPLMMAVHRKVLKFAGQPPFEHSPIRFCTQNGDYVILDTSWASFVNPWSRKVVFIVGRHKVRTSPLNEDVFAARSREMKGVGREVGELQGQIYKLLLQPVHSNSSSGYGSLVSSGSYEHYISVASSSDSNGNCLEEMHREPTKFQHVFVDVNRLKNVGQQLYINSHSKALAESERAPHAQLKGGKPHAAPILPCAAYGDVRSGHHILSYQQISCMESIIRYLEGCNVPALKRKCLSSANVDDDKQAQVLEDPSGVAPHQLLLPKPEEDTELQASPAVVGAPLTDLTLNTKALSVVSVTSQCSYSSTIVHVPRPESEVTAIEEGAMQSEQVELSPANAPSVATALEEIKLLGLTKEVLSAHTQKEEQHYVDRFRQRMLLSPCRSYLRQRGAGIEQAPSRDQRDVPSRQSSPARCKRSNKPGKSKRQKSLGSPGTDENGGTKETAAAPWTPCPGPPAAILPFSGPGFAVGPLAGGEPLFASGAPAPVIPPCLPYVLPSSPTLPVPFTGAFSAVLLHTFPMCTAALPPPFFPALPCTMMPPGPPSTALEPVEQASPPSTPLSAEEEQQEAAGGQPPLFSSSRSSSPLQLNLLQEELPKPPESPSKARPGACAELKRDEDGENHDGHSLSSELSDLLLLEAAQSGTGSAESGWPVSGSNGSSSNRTSGCGTGSRNSSKYFASNDSSETSKRGKKNREAEGGAGRAGQPARAKEDVLKEDLAKLAAMADRQPRFTKGQEEELAEVHPWIRTQSIPQEIDTQGCIACEGQSAGCKVAVPDERLHQEDGSKDLLDCVMLPSAAPN